MKIDQTAFNQIATTLAGHFDSMFYVDTESGNYKVFVEPQLFEELKIPSEGEDFFAMARENAHKYVFPDDLDLVMRIHDKEKVLENLARNGSFSASCRLLIHGKIIHIRHIDIMCEDKKHILFCMENIDDEIREKEEQERNLRFAERMARRDELTGIRNKNAFLECSQEIDKRIQAIDRNLSFGIVMCDVNDLKRINDTRGHNFGDEILQRTSRMLCDIFKKSQIFRIGGDEFVVILFDEDYQIREELFENLKRESFANSRSRSGPVVASGLSAFDHSRDIRFSDVFKRADRQMYENKKELKANSPVGNFRNAVSMEIPVPEERRRLLDGWFGALFTLAGGGYVYLNDLRYDYSRWSLAFVDDFGIQSEYIYHAGKMWQQYVHPDDLADYKEVVDAVINGESDMKYLRYRARRLDGSYIVLQPRAFILNDSQGIPEYFGGILVPQLL